MEESNLSVQIASLRKLLGPSPNGGEWVATVPRVGYRFVFETHDGRLGRVIPTLAVLPFTNISKEPEEEIFADGLVEDIITTLSKLSGLIVIASHSSFAYKGRSVDVRQVGNELGASYVLQGSVRKNIDTIRITTQLINAETGANVWAERYDRNLADIFEIQDEITLRLATEMQVHLTEGDAARLRYTTTTNVAAWSHWVRGRGFLLKGPERENKAQAQMHWERALACIRQVLAPLNAALAFVEFTNARLKGGRSSGGDGEGEGLRREGAEARSCERRCLRSSRPHPAIGPALRRSYRNGSQGNSSCAR